MLLIGAKTRDTRIFPSRLKLKRGLRDAVVWRYMPESRTCPLQLSRAGCRDTRENRMTGRVVELVYTRHLKCLGASHAGSTPVSPTIFPLPVNFEFDPGHQSDQLTIFASLSASLYNASGPTLVHSATVNTPIAGYATVSLTPSGVLNAGSYDVRLTGVMNASITPNPTGESGGDNPGGDS